MTIRHVGPNRHELVARADRLELVLRYKLTEFKILASGRRPDAPDFSAAQRPVDRF